MRIVVKNLTYAYNEKTSFKNVAIDNVSLTVEEGEFFGIIGHTGSGKSTFVQHLNALVPVTHGELSVGEVNLKKHSKKEYKKISFVYVKYCLLGFLLLRIFQVHF